MQKREGLITKKHYLKLSILVLILFSSSLFYGQERKRVLFISSYNSSFPTYFDHIDGLRSVLHPDTFLIDIENFDSKRFKDSVNTQLFEKRLLYKLEKGNKYDIIIVADDNAFNYSLKHQNDFFKDIPIVFLGVNNFEKAIAQNNNPQVTGVAETSSFEENIRLMLSLFPSEEIYAISDNSVTGKLDLKTYFTFAEKFPEVKFKSISLADYTLSEFEDQLKKIPKSAPVLFIAVYHLNDGRTMSFDEGVGIMKKNLKSPIFHLWHLGLNDHVFGGKVIFHFQQAKQAGLLAKGIIRKDDPAQLTVIQNSPTRYVFNYTAVQKFGVSIDKLPKNSQIIYLSESFWDKYKNEILFVISMVTLLALLSIGMFINILKRRKVEKKLKFQNLEYALLNKRLEIAKQRAEDSNSLKTAFLNNISHEFRTPMNGIIGFAELLPYAESDKKQKRYIHEIKRGCNQLLNIITDTIEVSQIQSNQSIIEKSEFDLRELLDSIFNDSHQFNSTTDLQMDLFINYPELIINTDRQKLKLSVRHLIENAIKFTPKGHIVLRSSISGDTVFIEVGDTGIGIAQDQLENIFEVYRQLEKGEARSFGGNGIGLSIVKSHIELLGGTIKINSAIGKGTTVVLNIPIQTQ